jgi:hypothetical protein
MRFAAICWVILGVAALTAQQPSTPVSVRSINVEPVSTSSVPLNALDMPAFAAALKSKGIHLAVETRFDPAAVEKAADVIQDMYRDQGQKVRVRHMVAQITPRGVDVAFEVIQLCACD